MMKIIIHLTSNRLAHLRPGDLMLPELGHYALILASLLAAMQMVVPFWGLRSGQVIHLQLSRYLAIAQFLLIGLSMAMLANALISNDFSVAYVAEHSNRHLPVIYRFCALWGAHEGSMLFWVFMLNAWGSAVALLPSPLSLVLRVRTLAVLACIAMGFYLFVLLTSNPFLRILTSIPSDGRDLNPILQDPGLAIHPPMLYMGYVGFAVSFAFAMAALMTNEVNALWARQVRFWTLIAWCFLTLGIVLGSAWAYRELGWGGWWFWDPVENASLLPWLVGTALIHSLVATERRGLFRAWTVLLSICAFSLSLLGTFLVRSGVLISVHAFASDPRRGLYMLLFLLLMVGGALTLFAWRARSLMARGYFAPASRETFLLMNNVLLFVGMVTVLLGTLYPLVMDVLHLEKLSVGAPYFNLMFVPIAVVLLILMGVAPQLGWQYASIDMVHFLRRMLGCLVLSILFAMLALWGAHAQFSLSVLLGLMLIFWLFMHLIWQGLPHSHSWWQWRVWRRRHWGMLIAHAGMGVTALGILLSNVYSVERDVRMQVGDRVQVGPYHFKWMAIHTLQGPNYVGTQATVRVSGPYHQWHAFYLYPQQRIFPISHMEVSKAAINAGIFRDLYIALGNPLPDQAWAVRIYYKPFVRWIWAGGLMMMGGGLLSCLRRWRVNGWSYAFGCSARLRAMIG